MEDYQEVGAWDERRRLELLVSTERYLALSRKPNVADYGHEKVPTVSNVFVCFL